MSKATLSPEIQKKCQHYRMSAQEYNKACELVGHPLTDIEWPLFSALWSEHCSYKSSKIHLRRFYNKNNRVLEAEGENAGVVDLGQGERVAFKMESHNHPSFIEPYQGAATGVGGILRDIFTMGARPIAIADYLCFGEQSAPRMDILIDGVVRGIGGYGNCVGVPTVTGQTNFHSSYNQNILVNAMAVGLFRPNEKIALSKAQGVGNLVVYVGAKTGKDGVHGASMASESFDENSEKKKPNVQIGDPYFEKLLIESCLEVIQKDLVVSIQDMGAAGLTSSSFEMASKGQLGMEIHLDKVPQRDSSITPEEILLSESQERMLMIVKPENLGEIQDAFARWGLDAVPIGHLLRERSVKLMWHGELLTSIDPDLLVENAPRHERPYHKWESKNKVEKLTKPAIGSAEKAADTKKEIPLDFIYRQYDQRVGLNTIKDCESPIAVLRLKDSGRGLGIAVGCRPEIMRMDAQLGAYDSVAYPALQMACEGIEPVAVTDCLNFGNPERPEIMSEFVASVEAISEICKSLDAPVVSGNVSFYNETIGHNVTSTPATGLVGLRETINDLKPSYFTNENDSVYLVSLPMVSYCGVWADKPQWTGQFDCDQVTKFIAAVRKLALMQNVTCLRTVTSAGLKATLNKLSTKGVGVKLASAEILDEPQYLYQVVVSGQNLDANLSQIFSDLTTVKFEKLGTTKKGEVI
jgi:phosphoribosylformylglycinamidine synthase